MTNVCIRIFETVSGSQEFLAIIPSFAKTGTISNLRREISNGELLTKEEYVFVNNERAYEIKEEDDVTIDEFATDANIKDVISIEGKFVKEDETATATSDEDESLDDLETSRATSTASEPSGSENSKTKSAFWQVFKYQNSWEMKNVKIYSTEEINKARGMRAAYFRFWNQRVKALCSQTPNISKRSLCQQINEEWRSEQHSILQQETEVLKKTTETPPASLKSGTLNANLLRMEEATKELEDTTDKLTNKTLSAKERNDYEAVQRRAKSNLKRAQESMRKNLKVKKCKIDAFVDSSKK